MSGRISLFTIILNPIFEMIRSLSVGAADKQKKLALIYLLFGFTGIPQIVGGEIKKGFIILLSLILALVFNYVKNIMVLRQILYLFWVINYVITIFNFTNFDKKGWKSNVISRLTFLILALVPLELSFLYIFNISK